jgi:hypothetical protein
VVALFWTLVCMSMDAEKLSSWLFTKDTHVNTAINALKSAVSINKNFFILFLFFNVYTVVNYAVNVLTTMQRYGGFGRWANILQTFA